MLSPASISAAKCITPSKLPLAERGLHQRTVCQVAFDQRGASAAAPRAAMAEIVEYRYLMARGQQQPGYRTSDITCPARH